jgi:hypothetical protein
MLSVTIVHNAECHYTECRGALLAFLFVSCRLYHADLEILSLGGVG